MPIRPENKALYPPNWKDIRAEVLDRAGHRCECCHVPNYSFREKARIVLTVMHLDHNPTNCDRSNLKAACQKCHFEHDRDDNLKKRNTYKYLDREVAGQEKLL